MRRILFFLFVGWVVFGCDSKRVFEDYKQIAAEGWNKDSVKTFEVVAVDATQNHNVYINIRNKGNYPNSNIWLFLKIQSPGGEILTDTVEYTLAEPNGKWRGSGIGDLFDNQFLYRQNVYFPEKGIYQFSIQHGMRTNVLEGIHDIGLRVEKKTN